MSTHKHRVLSYPNPNHNIRKNDEKCIVNTTGI